SFTSLERAWLEGHEPRQREHVVPYIKYSGLFNIGSVENEVDLSKEQHRWTVDEPQDLEFIRRIYTKLYKEGVPSFGMNEVLELLEQHPDLREVNQGIMLNEGSYRAFAREEPLPAQARNLVRSKELGVRADRMIPARLHNLPRQYFQNVPVFVNHGKGSHVWDVDGNEYIDYSMGFGSVILGHNYRVVTEAVGRQIQNGLVFSLPHLLEVELCEMLVDILPSVENVHFGSSISDIYSEAVRAARLHTGRDFVAICESGTLRDGHADFITQNNGIPEAVRKFTLPFDPKNVESLEFIFETYGPRVAAVVMDPIVISEPQGDFLRRVRELTEREGIVLIFDETFTGFRLSLGGAQEYFGVTPDLTCYSNSLGNGYPIAAVAGRKEVMESFGEILVPASFGSQPFSLSAAKTTIAEMREKDVAGHLWEVGRRLRDGYNVLADECDIAENTECVGVGPLTTVSFKDTLEASGIILGNLFQQECLKRGVLFSGEHNLSYSHSHDDIDQTLRVYSTVMRICADALTESNLLDRLDGERAQFVLRSEQS
ncbi:MAG: aminotransferase class III-fold pyridoxal phosphate-dependent enzyme, partial [Chloroflexota bacterium]|nr:aminotransferase class III-fold pyridoxal phosphate-dependent enzyme [Chloroflexota bacterium]